MNLFPAEETDGKYCLWVELNDMPLGKYWFKVTSVTIASQEIILKLAQIRPYETKTKAQNCDTSSIEFNEVNNFSCNFEGFTKKMVKYNNLILGIQCDNSMGITQIQRCSDSNYNYIYSKCSTIHRRFHSSLGQRVEHHNS